MELLEDLSKSEKSNTFMSVTTGFSLLSLITASIVASIESGKEFICIATTIVSFLTLVITVLFLSMTWNTSTNTVKIFCCFLIILQTGIVSNYLYLTILLLRKNKNKKEYNQIDVLNKSGISMIGFITLLNAGITTYLLQNNNDNDNIQYQRSSPLFKEKELDIEYNNDLNKNYGGTLIKEDDITNDSEIDSEIKNNTVETGDQDYEIVYKGGATKQRQSLESVGDEDNEYDQYDQYIFK